VRRAALLSYGPASATRTSRLYEAAHRRGHVNRAFGAFAPSGGDQEAAPLVLASDNRPASRKTRESGWVPASFAGTRGCHCSSAGRGAADDPDGRSYRRAAGGRDRPVSNEGSSNCRTPVRGRRRDRSRAHSPQQSLPACAASPGGLNVGPSTRASHRATQFASFVPTPDIRAIGGLCSVPAVERFLNEMPRRSASSAQDSLRPAFACKSRSTKLAAPGGDPAPRLPRASSQRSGGASRIAG